MSIDELLALDRGEVKARIGTATGEAQLAQWFREARDQYADISDDVESFRRAGTATDDWLRRAGGRLSALAKARRWTSERMHELGFVPPWTATDPRLRHIRALEAKNRKYADALRDAGVEFPS